jgi:chitinase
VKYATANGTARVPSDYRAATGTLTFAAGETSKTITVLVVGDRIREAAEVFYLNLSAPSGATIAAGSGRGVILNDD